MKNHLILLPLLAALAPLAGCSSFAAFMVGSGELDDESVRRTQAKQDEERRERMRSNSNIRPAEYEAMNNKLGGSSTPTTPRPTADELAKKVEEDRRRQASE